MLALLASTGMMLSMIFEAGAFVAPPSPGAGAARPQASLVRNTVGSETSWSSSGDSSTATYAALAVGAGAALALLQRLDRRAGLAARRFQKFERKWWSVEETRDPTSLPMWQRDFRYGYQVLRRSMVEARKKGKKIFWDVRVLYSGNTGCEVEMLNSGLPGFIPIGEEGKAPAGQEPPRMEVGKVYRVECLACPQIRVSNGEKRHSPWPEIEKKAPLKKACPYFSHFMWLEQQHAIEKAKELEDGSVVKASVHKHCPKGLVMTLEGEHQPKGMLAMQDISRLKSSHKYVAKMFPLGTELTVYVVHADEENGRITLSTKEFEDDEHVGWMLSFPERCFQRAQQAVDIYHAKRDKFIRYCQRGGKHMRQLETA